MNIFLETERLILKTPELDDIEDLVTLQSDSDVMKYIGNGVRTREETLKFLKTAVDHQAKHGFSFCSVYLKENKKFIGQAGLFYLAYNDAQSNIEVGYRLHKFAWGKGYATELTKSLIEWGFKHLAVNKLVAVTHPDNMKSQSVLKKAGMWYTGKIMYLDNEVPCFEIYREDSIELSPYNAEWPSMAKAEIQVLRKLLPQHHVIDVQHVGSTAIPGMSAKPIIDIQVAVHSLAAIKKTAIDALKTLGYEYWAENPDPARMFFVKGMPPFGKGRTHHVHIVEPTSKHWKGKIIFRDYLIAHPEAAKEYQDLKNKLAKLHTYDREQYTEAKTEFIVKILKKTGVKW